MKKFIIPILMLCLGYAGMTNAANTDISSLNNVIYIEPFAASQGDQVVMSIKMKNTVSIRGFQFDLYLPDGVTAAKTAKGKIIASLTSNRLPEDDEHSLTLSEQGDGAVRFLCGSLYDETFTGTDGEIATLTVNIDGGMANGDYPIYLRTMKLTETDISKYYETDEIETTLTIGAAGYTILDEISTVAPVAAEGVNVRVLRAIKADSWSTICLPFAMSEAQVKAAFGDDVDVRDFTSWSSEEDNDGNIISIQIGFTPVTAIEANHPYIIKVSSAISEFTVDGVDIDPEEEPIVQVGKKKAEKGFFTGTYVADTTVPEDNLFLNGNRFYYSNGNTKMKAFRGYFELYDVIDTELAAARITIVESETTGITEYRGKLSDDIYYDLQGRKVETPRKGVYIVNGNKIAVK